MPQRTPMMAMGVGTELLACLAFGWGAGSWLDEKLACAPLLTLVGVAAGVGAAVKGLVREIRAYEREGGRLDDQRDDDGNRDRGP